MPCIEWEIIEKNIFSVYHPKVLNHVSKHLFLPKAIEAYEFENIEGTFDRLRSYHLQVSWCMFLVVCVGDMS